MKDLPEELLYKILLQLPTTTLVKSARHVCKLWRSIISDPNFAEAHYTRSVDDDDGKTLLFQRKILDYKNGFFMVSSTGSIDIIGRNLRLSKDMSPLKTSTSVCKGLVLHINRKHGFLRFFLSNPILNQTITLPTMRAVNFTGYFCTSGFGYDCKSKEYEVIIVFNSTRGRREKSILHRCRISLGPEKKASTSCWEQVGSVDQEVCRRHKGVVINGKIHWLLKPKSLEVKILTFEMETESTNFFRFRLSPEAGVIQNIVLDDRSTEKLCVHVKYRNYGTVWVMMEYGNEKSFVEDFDLLTSRFGFVYSGHWKRNLHLFQRNHGAFDYLVVDKKTKEIKNFIDFGEPNFFNNFYLFTFVPALFSLSNEHQEQKRELIEVVDFAIDS